MGPDDARLHDVRGWLSKAELDLKAAAHEMAAPAEGLWGDVMARCAFRKTHHLEELGQQCVALDSTLGPVADQAAPLTEYAWKFRYPGEADEAERADAEKALAAARNVYDAILARVPPKARL
jgi:hypothetical protein